MNERPDNGMVSIMWFRRDLRLDDNAALYHALRSPYPVVPVFIFDKHILDDLEEYDKRIQFIYDTLEDLQAQLKKLGTGMEVLYDTPQNAYRELTKKYKVARVYANEDYEQYALDRDALIAEELKKAGATFSLHKDHVIFAKSEVVKDDGLPYTVFTPYSRRWKATLTPFHLKPYPTRKYFSRFHPGIGNQLPSLKAMGFKETDHEFPSARISSEKIKDYAQHRDYPALDGTTRAGIHLRFGTISIRQLAARAQEESAVYLNELIWRDFYSQVLWHFAHVRKGHSFKQEFDKLKWRNNQQEFEAWCAGKTGYPIVDAGMRQMNETGFMHNRLRMITASFLTKHLLIDWRWGEAYFARQLLDYDYASNCGGWQWAASCGCDAVPYFRIFSPDQQVKRFDKDLAFIRKWVPELDTFDYPEPIVAHDVARQRALDTYSKVRSNKG